MCQLAGSVLELEALDLEPPSTLVLRIAGDGRALETRANHLSNSAGYPVSIIPAEEDSLYWRGIRELEWVGDNAALLKVPITPKGIAVLDQNLVSFAAARRYSVAGNLAWICWPGDRPLDELDRILQSTGLSGLVIRGSADRVHLGARQTGPFLKRVKEAFDPHNRFPGF